MIVFTSITNNYLPKARILGVSIKKFHPDWKFIVVISEPPHESIILKNEPFDDVISILDLDIPARNAWIFKHSVMEICTAVKGPAAFYIATTEKSDKLIFLDPDTVLFDRLDDISTLLDKHPIILTPHQLKPENNKDDILNNEVCFLKHGIFNLGFFAVKCEGQGLEFLNWYRERLLEFCYIDFNWGLYTDQRWCDLIPVVFDRMYIYRDPGANVARWNLSQRNLYMNGEGRYMVDGTTLKFFHFSGYDSGQGKFEIKRYIDGEHCFYKLWDWYASEHKKYDFSNVSKCTWKYDSFNSGHVILKEMRRLYRDRVDLQTFFPDPYHNDATLNSYELWYAHHFLSVSPVEEPRVKLHRWIDRRLDEINKMRRYFKKGKDFN